MLNVFSSPGDPIFYLHHTWLDKLWWDWQSQNLTSRVKEIGGTNKVSPFLSMPHTSNTTFAEVLAAPTPGCFPFPFPPTTAPTNSSPPASHVEDVMSVKIAGDPADVTTLGHVLTVHGSIPDATINDVMNIQGSLLCYEYV